MLGSIIKRNQIGGNHRNLKNLLRRITESLFFSSFLKKIIIKSINTIKNFKKQDLIDSTARRPGPFLFNKI